MLFKKKDKKLPQTTGGIMRNQEIAVYSFCREFERFPCLNVQANGFVPTTFKQGPQHLHSCLVVSFLAAAVSCFPMKFPRTPLTANRSFGITPAQFILRDSGRAVAKLCSYTAALGNGGSHAPLIAFSSS